jgi:3-oxoacyl-[acyl-carrier-protein] synthase-1
MSLVHLNETNRLRTPEQPVGLCPGEGAACVLLESGDGARGRLHVLGAAVPPSRLTPDAAEPTVWRQANVPGIANAVVEAIRQALSAAGVEPPFRGDVIVDLNGELWRAAAWGHAQPALTALLDAATTRPIFPAITYGDIGAVGPVAALCIAERSFARGFASGARTLIVSVSDLGRSSAIVVGREEGL